jgi:hypothetical protein
MVPPHNSDARHRRRWRVSTELERSRRPAAGAHHTLRYTGGGRPAGRIPQGLGSRHRHRAHSAEPGAIGTAGRTTPSMDSAAAPPARKRDRVAVHGPGRTCDRAVAQTRTRTMSHPHSVDPYPATQRPQPGTSDFARSQPDFGRRRAAPHPSATATRNQPVAQPGRGRDSSLAARPRAAAPYPRSTRPRPSAGSAPSRRNGNPEPTGRPAGAKTRLATQDRRVTTAVNQTAGSGGPRQWRLGAHLSPSRERSASRPD